MDTLTDKLIFPPSSVCSLLISTDILTLYEKVHEFRKGIFL